MNWAIDLLRNSPELAIFLTLAMGFAVGKLRLGRFSLGSVTGVLLAGVLVGQLGVVVPATVKSTFFLLFLFSVGYSVGPQFIHSLRRQGLPQMAFAVCVCVMCLATAWGAAMIAGFDAGNAAGLLSGASTISAVIGVATDTINHLGISPADKQAAISHIPVAYAITYIFGTAGTAWILSVIGPRMLGRDVVAQTREYEKTLGGDFSANDPDMGQAYDGASFRVVELGGKFFDTRRTVAQVEDLMLSHGCVVYIERIRTSTGILIHEPEPGTMLAKGDRVALNGPIEALIKDEQMIGREVADVALLSFQTEMLEVVVSDKHAIGKSLDAIRTHRARHGVTLKNIIRAGHEIPLLPSVKLQRGDIVEIVGSKRNCERFAQWLGVARRKGAATDIIYMALGILLGGVLGSLTVHAGSIPVSLSVSGGVLVMGIVLGWFHGMHPNVGTIPEPSVWLMNNLGLNVFIAVVGIGAGPDFVEGLRHSGAALLVAGIAVSSLPMLGGLLLGRYVFKFHPAITLGACAGSRTTTAALGAIQQTLGSKVPSLSYTTTYAIGNTLLIVWGVVIVLIT